MHHINKHLQQITHPRQIPPKIQRKRPPPLRDFKFTIELARSVGGGLRHGGCAPGDVVSPVYPLRRLPRLVDEELEAVVGAPPGVAPQLAGLHAPGESVEVAAPEGAYADAVVDWIVRAVERAILGLRSQ